MTKSQVILPIVGMTCANCAAVIERGLNTLKDIDNASVNLASERAIVQYELEQLSLIELVANVEGTGLSSDQFEKRALNEAGVALLSGAGFGQRGKGYVRFSYANSVENLQKAVAHLTAFVEGMG